MNYPFRKVISLLLVLGLLTAVSCGTTASPNADTSANVTDTSVSTESKSVVNWESANLPVRDYGGKQFTFLQANVSNLAHSWHLVAPEEMNGESLNDAIYNRNKKIEEIYNIEISTVYTGSLKNDINNAINAGDDEYSCMFAGMDVAFPMAQEGKFFNFYNLPYTDLEAEWWDNSVIEDLSYHDKLYTLCGDISPIVNIRCYGMIFNKDMCTQLNLQTPYSYVLNGTWTLDVFNKYISDVNADLNGDSQMDYNDRWGFFSQNGCAYMMYFSGGGEVVSKNKDEFTISFNTERNIQLSVDALKIAIDKSKTLMANQYVTDHDGSWTAATSWFASGGSLFRSTSLEPVPRDLRSLDVNFGIIPFPKLDDTQSQYYTLPEEYSKMICIPVTADPEFASLIIESLAAESVSTVSEAFYDVLLNGKAVRDEESSAMLDIIFEGKRFDMGFIGGIASFRSMLLNLETSASTDVASAYASALTSAKTELQKILDNFDAID